MVSETQINGVRHT